jgi:DNA-binding NarL/FixJ family response regulator
VSGEAVDAAGGSARSTAWLIGLPPELARAARATLVANGIEPRAGKSAPETTVAIIGSPGVAPAEQRRRARAVVERTAPRPVVAITDLQRRGMVQRLLTAGVHGLVLVGDIERSLAITVRAVAAGQLCVSGIVRGAVVPRPLTTRERQILAMVIMGLTNAEIAARLHIAESTVKSHLASTFDKLDVRSRTEAMALVTDPQEMLSTGVVGLSGGEERG